MMEEYGEKLTIKRRGSGHCDAFQKLFVGEHI